MQLALAWALDATLTEEYADWFNRVIIAWVLAGAPQPKRKPRKQRVRRPGDAFCE